MKYKLIQKANPLEPETKRKWYASPVKAGTINNYQLSKGIAGKSSLTRGAVMNVIENMVDEIPKYLMEGYSVNLNNFGTLRLSLSSEGVSDPDEFTADNIKNMRVVFTPSPEFRSTLSKMKLEKTE
ncbi:MULTISPECIES: HU family DNA-binding protein [Proteiniphilum]|jgi:predicted histone-like DNA-binding protein|uniref:HU family DNA-binding protein n=1 Tax=Proteiniphilum TaxID=294702 RepID=UPI001EEC0765|nr:MULTISPECIES: HU family DNA-binding protein [Proteiniphilum]ULB33050.1 HU family DNA-binding protein [Proteiniphilum propionicum]